MAAKGPTGQRVVDLNTELVIVISGEENVWVWGAEIQVPDCVNRLVRGPTDAIPKPLLGKLVYPIDCPVVHAGVVPRRQVDARGRVPIIERDRLCLDLQGYHRGHDAG